MEVRRITGMALVTLMTLVAACTPAPAPSDAETVGDADAGSADHQLPDPDATALPASEPTSTPTPAVDPAEIGANELGEIPVLMYHRLLPDGGGEYDSTPEEFRAELEYLCEHDYRPVRVIDLVRGEIDVPAGTTPVVLTFDDSTREQLGFTADGEVDPETSSGILLDVARDCDGFEPVASLYVNAYPFGGGHDSEDLVRWLHEHGFELGNHTSGHANLSTLSAGEVQRELAEGVAVITDIVPAAEVATMSLPLGIWPSDRGLAVEGSSQGQSYAHEGILLVGAGPASSPYHSEFDALAVPRIRSGPWDGGDPNFTSGFWLDVFERYPERRYISDGTPSTISFPENHADALDEAFEDRANPYPVAVD